MRSEDFAVRFANNYLNEAFAFANGTCLLAMNGIFPTLNLRPFSFAARSVSPTLATCG